MKNKTLFLITAGILAVTVFTSIPALGSTFRSTQSQQSVTQSISSNANTGNNAAYINSDSSSNSLSGGSPSSQTSTTSLVVATLNGNQQTIDTNHDPSTYPNIVVQKGVPVVWTINASTQSLQSCNSYVVFPSINMQKQLKQGKNVIQFTPTQTGTFQYYCSMHMYIGTITVVDDINNYDKSTIQNKVDSIAPTGGGGGCCAR